MLYLEFFDKHVDMMVILTCKSNKKLYDIYMDIIEQIEEESNYAEIIRLENQRKLYHIGCGFAALLNDKGYDSVINASEEDARNYWIEVEPLINCGKYSMVIRAAVLELASEFTYLNPVVEDTTHVHNHGSAVYPSFRLTFDTKDKFLQALQFAKNNNFEFSIVGGY